VINIFRLNTFLLLQILFLFVACGDSDTSFPEKVPVEIILTPDIEIIPSEPLVNDNINFSHFNHLYNEINFNGKKVGIIYI